MNTKKKKSSHSDLRVLIGKGAEILLETNLGSGRETDHNLYSEDQNKKKQQEQVSQSEELNFFRKKVKSKKTKRSSRFRVKVNTNQEKDKRITVLVTNLSLLAL